MQILTLALFATVFAGVCAAQAPLPGVPLSKWIDYVEDDFRQRGVFRAPGDPILADLQPVLDAFPRILPLAQLTLARVIRGVPGSLSMLRAQYKQATPNRNFDVSIERLKTADTAPAALAALLRRTRPYRPGPTVGQLSYHRADDRSGDHFVYFRANVIVIVRCDGADSALSGADLAGRIDRVLIELLDR